jgi:diaminopimelate decarboxylase
MNHFSYRSGRLFAEDVDLAALAEEAGTPVYVYSTATLERHYRIFAAGFPSDTLIAFSVKANGNVAVLKTLARLGAGADVVSAGELKKALAAGIPSGKIVFSGVGKTKPEMRLALAAGIRQFNVESEPELEALNEVAVELETQAAIAIRVNPDVDARSHAKISTGTSEFHGRGRAKLTRMRPHFPASRWSVLTFISAARSPSLRPLKKLSVAWRS